MPSRAEWEETLRKLEEDVNTLQQEEGGQLPPPTEQKQTGPDDYNEYDDDVLPPSLRQALREKTNNDY
jgi:hypothetical protein